MSGRASSYRRSSHGAGCDDGVSLTTTTSPMSVKLLSDFIDKFATALSQVQPSVLADAWVEGRTKERTQIYRDILCSVAAAMTPMLTVKEQHCLIDFVLGKPIELDGVDSKAIVPLIALESENIVTGTCKEVDNLCAMASPIKVLITCAIWSREPGKQDDREKTLERWRSIHAAHVAALPGRAEDAFVVIVGERTRKKLRFFKEVLSAPGVVSAALVDLIPPIQLP